MKLIPSEALHLKPQTTKPAKPEKILIAKQELLRLSDSLKFYANNTLESNSSLTPKQVKKLVDDLKNKGFLNIAIIENFKQKSFRKPSRTTSKKSKSN